MKLSNTLSQFMDVVPVPFRFSFFTCLPILLLSILATSLDAQSSNKEIILYKDFLFLNSHIRNLNIHEGSGVIKDYGYAVALHKVKDERRYRQWELKVAFDKSTEPTKVYKTQEYQLSYRKGKYWKKPILKTIRPRHSVAIHLNYTGDDIDVSESYDFPIDNRYGGIGLDYLLGMEIPLSDKMNIHLDYNIASVSLGGNYRYSHNPTLTERQRKQGGFDFDMNSRRVLKVGLGIRL